MEYRVYGLLEASHAGLSLGMRLDPEAAEGLRAHHERPIGRSRVARAPSVPPRATRERPLSRISGNPAG